MAVNQSAVTILTADGGKIVENGLMQFTGSATSGTLPQMAAWVSGTAQQNPVGYPITVVLAPTGDATNNAATVAVAISPDNTTYTTVATWSLAAGVNNTGAITNIVNQPLPVGWYIKITIGAHATVAQSSYYG